MNIVQHVEFKYHGMDLKADVFDIEYKHGEFFYSMFLDAIAKNGDDRVDVAEWYNILFDITTADDPKAKAQEYRNEFDKLIEEQCEEDDDDSSYHSY